MIWTFDLHCKSNEPNYVYKTKTKSLSFIKIDCEGHDKEILPTLKDIVEKNRPIIQTEIYDGLSIGEKQQ